MQAKQQNRSVSFYLVKNGVETFITTINEAGEQNLRDFYERKGLGKCIKVVPVYSDEEKAEMERKREELRAKMEASKFVATPIDTPPTIEQPKKRRGRQPKTK